MAPGEVDLVSKGNFIAENLFKFCVAPDSGKRLRETGVVAPATTLKNKCARSAFEWAASVTQKKKYFTLAACRMAIKTLISMKGVDIPLIPTLPLDMWVEQQAKIVCHLAQRSRRNCRSQYRFCGYKQMSWMDIQDTLPLQVGCVENCDNHHISLYKQLETLWSFIEKINKHNMFLLNCLLVHTMLHVTDAGTDDGPGACRWPEAGQLSFLCSCKFLQVKLVKAGDKQV